MLGVFCDLEIVVNNNNRHNKEGNLIFCNFILPNLPGKVQQFILAKMTPGIIVLLSTEDKKNITSYFRNCRVMVVGQAKAHHLKQNVTALARHAVTAILIS